MCVLVRDSWLVGQPFVLHSVGGVTLVGQVASEQIMVRISLKKMRVKCFKKKWEP